MDKMSSLEPLFIDITWGAGGSTSDLTLDICKNTQQFMCIETQMHLTYYLHRVYAFTENVTAKKK